MVVWVLFWNEIVKIKRNLKQAITPRLLDTGIGFVLEWNSQSGTTIGVNSLWDDLYRYRILNWCHVNDYRDTRGHWDDFVLEWKSHCCHVNTPNFCQALDPKNPVLNAAILKIV